MRSDGYIQEKEVEEKVLGVVWKREGGLSSLLLFVLLLWPWWVSVSLVLELLYSSSFLSPLSFLLSRR
jgi:hypothetical protein